MDRGWLDMHTRDLVSVDDVMEECDVLDAIENAEARAREANK